MLLLYPRLRRDPGGPLIVQTIMSSHSAESDPGTEVFEQHRRRLIGIAYGMLGSVMDAEDVVQDVYLRWAGVDHTTVETPAAYLTTMTTRQAINQLKTARKRRETYVGPWLPEPLVTELDADPAEIVAGAEHLSLSLLSALERINPTERAVFLLREVFDLDYNEIANVVDKSPANCRQIAGRARSHIGDSPSSHSSRDSEHESELLPAYLEAIATADVDALTRVFADDVILWSDGGGKARAARHPLHGAARVARYLVGVTPQTPANTAVKVVRVNGDPAFMGILDGQCIGLVAFEIADGLITGIRAILNPDKLSRVETE